MRGRGENLEERTEEEQMTPRVQHIRTGEGDRQAYRKDAADAAPRSADGNSAGTAPRPGRAGRQRRVLKDLLIAVLLVILYIALRPAYLAYRDREFATTCYGAREYVAEKYRDRVQEALDAGQDPEQINYPALVSSVFREIYNAEVTEDLTVPGLCYAGGTMQIRIDEKTHLVTISCSAPGHTPCVEQ